MALPSELPGNNYDEARRWLALAKQDLQGARTLHQDDLPGRQSCLSAQMAAEKALKAVLIDAEVPFRKLHELGPLVELLPANVKSRFDRDELERLTPWALDGRYSEEHVESSFANTTDMIDIAQSTIDAVDMILDNPAG